MIKNKEKKQSSFHVGYGKLPPQNVEAEKAVLGQLLSGSSRIVEVIELLPDADRFYKDTHQRIYAAILRCVSKGQKIDEVTVMTELMNSDELEQAGGGFVLMQLTKDIAFDHTILNHCDAIVEAYKRRETIRISQELLGQAYDTTEEIDKSVHEAEKELLKVITEGDVSESKSLKDLVVGFNEDLYAAQQNENHVTGVPTGIHFLDDVTNGWQNGDLIILAARPSCGKTAFALNLAESAALDRKYPVGFFSLEMDSGSLMKRIVSSETRIDLEKIRNGTVSSAELNHINVSMDRVINLPIHIDDTFSVNINQLRARAKRIKRKHGIGMIVVDYLQIMQGIDKKGTREQEIASISRGLKGIAKELEIPVLALSQMSRAFDVRGEKSREPQLSDLRESGAIEQDADIVIFLYHEQDADGHQKNIIKVAKNRNGKLGITDQCKFFGNIQKWMNPSDANAYMGKGSFTPFAGMTPHADSRIEPQKEVTAFDPEGLPF